MWACVGSRAEEFADGVPVDVTSATHTAFAAVRQALRRRAHVLSSIARARAVALYVGRSGSGAYFPVSAGAPAFLDATEATLRPLTRVGRCLRGGRRARSCPTASRIRWGARGSWAERSTAGGAVDRDRVRRRPHRRCARDR